MSKQNYTRTEEHKQKLRDAYPESNSLKGKTYEEIYGEEKAKIIKEKRSKSLKGVGLGKVGWNKGKTTPRHIVEKMIKNRTGKMTGSENHAWKGGKSFEKYGRKFNIGLKKLIRHRDNYKCAECGCPEIELDYRLCVHHIDENKKNNDVNNLISLCRKCHAKVHWSKKDWVKYFHNIIKEKCNVGSKRIVG